jgi:hypothetical protein
MNRLAYSAGAVAVAAALLSGCAASADAPQTPPTRSTQTPDAAPSPTVAPPAEREGQAAPVINGTVLSHEQVELGVADQEGLCAATLPDGTWVAIDPAQPLPAEVRGALQRAADEIPADPENPYGTDGTAQAAADANRGAASSILTVSYCHQIVLVRKQNTGYPGGETPNSVRWVASTLTGWPPLPDAGGAMGWGFTDSDKSRLLARLNDWVAAQPADSVDVIVQKG